MTDTTGLWTAVDGITRATTQHLHRDALKDVLEAVAAAPVTFCRVDDYRAATVTHGKVPSLWEQAEMALTTGSESSGGKPSPLATRSPADMDLMEIMLTIRESVSDNLVGRKLASVDVAFSLHADPCKQIRQLVAHIVSHEPDNVDWWTYRVEQWRRLLETYLKAVETGPKAMRLRVRCPTCRCEYLSVDDPNGGESKIQIRPIVAIYRDHWFRCFECQSCTSTWFAGDGVHLLKEEIAADELSRKPPEELIA